MPKQTSIPVSKKTLKFVQEYKAEFGFRSLDEAVQNSIRWGRAFAYIDSTQRRSLQERLNNLEAQVQKLGKLLAFCLTFMYEIKNKGEKENAK